MLKIQEIREIIKLIDQSSIDKFTYEAEGAKIKIVKSSGSVASATPVDVQTSLPDVQDSTSGAQVVTQTAPAKMEAPVEVAAPVAASVPVEKTVDASLKSIVSPMVGTFYKSSSPESAAFVQVGQKVGTEDVVCIVEAMKLFNEIEAEVSGEIVEILVKDGQLVEYGQPLFLVKEN
ncbi:acetyl-CoA carboxylase biotin carboxyl carrier protein [Sporosarcina sp. A2]|uniref:acetyl-CoA carboxylase biotin carboxyl carrier protein n=1 Tax=Sporosarcina sp. A2 TaxID=3393449 RepID=UPI003D7B45F4